MSRYFISLWQAKTLSYWLRHRQGLEIGRYASSAFSWSHGQPYVPHLKKTIVAKLMVIAGAMSVKGAF